MEQAMRDIVAQWLYNDLILSWPLVLFYKVVHVTVILG
jgi:hypothetical protein